MLPPCFDDSNLALKIFNVNKLILLFLRKKCLSISTLSAKLNATETGGSMERPKVIPQWMPTVEQRKHLAKMASEEGTTITGYIKQLVNSDMRKRR